MKVRQAVFIFFSILFTFYFSQPFLAASQWEQMVLYSCDRGIFYKTTSELDNPEPDPFNPGTFSGVRIFDGDRSTCWAEGVPGNGSGEALFFTIPENTGILHIINGSAGSEEDFFRNNRIKKMFLSLYVGVSPEAHVSEMAVQYFALKYDRDFIIELEDTPDEQDLDFPMARKELIEFKDRVAELFESEREADAGSPADEVHYILRLEIQDVYKGLETEDTCLAEIRIEEGFESVHSLYLGEDESSVLMDTDKETGVIVDRDKEAVFQIITHTEDNQWLICIKMPRENEGRVETEYVLYNTVAAKKIEKEILGEHVSDMYGFVKKEGKIFLEYFNSSASKIEYLDLEEIKLK
jgi:hypothetical protein